jgi:pyruvate kinase
LPLLAFVHDESVRARLAYSWGVESAVVAPAAKAETMATEVSRALVAMGTCHPGDVVVVVSGSRSGVAGYTDSVRVLRIE